MDIQAFTAAAYILLSNHHPRVEQEVHDDLRTLYLVHKIINAFKKITTDLGSEQGSDFTKEAVKALTSLHDMFAKDDEEQEHQLALLIPLLGKVAIKRSSGRSSGFESIPWSFELRVERSRLDLQASI